MRYALVIILITAGLPAMAAEKLTLSKANGGNARLSEYSPATSLERVWYSINDPSAPAQLDGAGVTTFFARSDFRFKGAGQIKAGEDVAAIEIRFLLYGVFGDHLITLSGTRVGDIQKGSSYQLNDMQWNSWGNDAEEYLTSVAFVARVRMKNGALWNYDPKALVAAVEKASLAAKPEALDPTKKK